MNYWSAEMTNLDVALPLFDYFQVRNVSFENLVLTYNSLQLQKTWAPRGAYTAQVLYNITRGWVTHNEVRH
jgi:alpha-L-fucosidase 2